MARKRCIGNDAAFFVYSILLYTFVYDRNYTVKHLRQKRGHNPRVGLQEKQTGRAGATYIRKGR